MFRSGPPLHALRAFHTGAIALALTGCLGETAYTPRTPHLLALGMKRGQPVLYRDGARIDLDDAAPAVQRCSPDTASELTEAASHQTSAQRDSVIGGLCEAFGFIVPPLFAVAGVFLWLSADHQQTADAHVIDAINRHNDAPECRP